MIYQSTFDILALVMRYIFCAIIVILTFRLLKITFKDVSIRSKANKKGSTTVGWLEVIEPEGDERYFEKVFPLKKENQIGSSNECNVQICITGVRNNHAFVSQKGNKIILSRYSSMRKIHVNGEKIRGNIELLDGDEIAIGDCLLGFYLSEEEEYDNVYEHNQHD